MFFKNSKREWEESARSWGGGAGAQNYKYMENKCQRGKNGVEQDYEMLDAQLTEKIYVLVRGKEVQTKDLQNFSNAQN